MKKILIFAVVLVVWGSNGALAENVPTIISMEHNVSCTINKACCINSSLLVKGYTFKIPLSKCKALHRKYTAEHRDEKFCNDLQKGKILEGI